MTGNANATAMISMVLLLSSLTTTISSPAGRIITSIFSFGDSIADTGNHCYLLFKAGKRANNCFLPYGDTFFHRPTGRSCDGRLIIDFMAEHLGLPLVPPFFGGNPNDFESGVNFAVGTATALHSDFLASKFGVTVTGTNVSLGVQLDLFKQWLPTLCGGDEDLLLPVGSESAGGGGGGCRRLLSNSLFALGEIGGNDYNLPLTAGRSFKEVQEIAPLDVAYIASVLKEIIELGAVNILVPGNFPIGCLPFYLNKFRTSNSKDYDPSTGCLTRLNRLSQHHNHLLQTQLSIARQLYPHVNIIYVDYYNAVLSIYRAPDQFGFTGETLKACCEGEGSVQCGNPWVKPCDDYSKYVNWDGLHFTEATYGLVARSILEEGLFTYPSFNILSSSSQLGGRNSGNYYT